MVQNSKHDIMMDCNLYRILIKNRYVHQAKKAITANKSPFFLGHCVGFCVCDNFLSAVADERI